MKSRIWFWVRFVPKCFKINFQFWKSDEVLVRFLLNPDPESAFNCQLTLGSSDLLFFSFFKNFKAHGYGFTPKIELRNRVPGSGAFGKIKIKFRKLKNKPPDLAGFWVMENGTGGSDRHQGGHLPAKLVFREVHRGHNVRVIGHF